jgi:hypothetical protein
MNFMIDKNLSLGVSTSRPIEIEIENVLRVETNFWKPSRFYRRSRLTFFWRRDRDLDRDLDKNRDFRASRPIEIEIENVPRVETNFWKPSRFSRRSRLTFFWRRDRDLDRDNVETNRDPQPYKNLNYQLSKKNHSWVFGQILLRGYLGLLENFEGPLFRILLHFYDRIFRNLPNCVHLCFGGTLTGDSVNERQWLKNFERFYTFRFCYL